jgi:aldose 1-epimerase
VTPSGAQHELVGGGYRAVVVEVGGGLRTLTRDGVDLVDGYAEDEMCVGGCGQVLMPWANRIADGRYAFGGREHRLALTEPARHNAIHGLVRWVPWTRAEGGPDFVVLTHELFPCPGYPWRLSSRTRWSVSDRGLRAEHVVTNRSDQEAPFGFGVHPYLVIPGVAVDDLELHVPAATRLAVDERLLPIGEVPVGEFDFRGPSRLGRRQLDTAFGDLVRRPDGTVAASIRAPDGRAVELRADAGTRWWQVFTGDALTGARHRRSVAIEPMTSPPDAFRSGRDRLALAPGASWSGWWEISASSA